MTGDERLRPAGGETSSAPLEPFSLAALHANIRKTLHFQLGDAAELYWIKALDAALSGEDPGYQAACLQAASNELLLEKLPQAAEATKANWLNYISGAYPEDIKTGDRLPNPNRQAQDRNLDQAAVVAAYRTVTGQSKQDLLQRIQEDDALAASNVDESIDEPLEVTVTRIQTGLAEQAQVQCKKISAGLPVKNPVARLGASILKRSHLEMSPEKNDRAKHEASRAARALVKILKELDNPEQIGALVTATVATDFIDRQLASHYGRIVRTAKGRLVEELEQVPITFAIPRATKKSHPRQSAPMPQAASQPTQPAPATPVPEPQAAQMPVAKEATVEIQEETVQAETVKILTPAEVGIKRLYQTTLEAYFDLFSRKEFRRPELIQFAGVLRKTPDNAKKACLFLALASFSGDNRAIHDAFETIENMPGTDKELRSPLYGLCSQAYGRTRSMPEQTIYALARQVNPDALLTYDHAKYIRPGTAFTHDTETPRGPDSTVIEISTRVDKAILQELLGELDILFPEPVKGFGQGMPASGDRRQTDYIRLPALRETRVRRILQRLGCELDVSGGKGSHVKVFNPATETTTTLSSQKGEVNPIPLSGLLDQLGIRQEDFVQAMRGKVN